MVIKSEDVSARVKPDVKIMARESMTKGGFDTMMKAGLADATAGRGMDVEDAFASRRGTITPPRKKSTGRCKIAVDAAFSNPDAWSEWQKVHFKGERPTPENLIPYCVETLAKENDCTSAQGNKQPTVRVSNFARKLTSRDGHRILPLSKK